MSFKAFSFRQFGLYLAGYISAVILAAFVATVAYFIISKSIINFQFLGDAKSMLRFTIPHRKIWEFVFTGFLYTSLFGLPGFLIAITIAKRMNWKTIWKFAGAGFLNGAFAHFLVFMWLGDYVFLLIIASMIGGAAGGAFYWIVSGNKLLDRE